MSMRDIIYSLPEQILESINLVSDFHPRKKKIDRILVCGMGGSGISGEILAALYQEIQIISNKNYTIPGYTDKNTLAILISYSGNTEEILNNYKLLTKHKAEMVVISSNGKLLKKKNKLKIKVPDGLPPRGALGYLFTPLPIILHRFGLIKTNPGRKLFSLVKFLKKYRNDIEKRAKILSKRIENKLPIIYSNSRLFSPISNRWQCQLNENAKILAHINIIPEMNHNEIVGLGKPAQMNKQLLLIFLNDPKAYSRNKIRVKIVKKIIRDRIKPVIDVNPKGNNNLQRLFWTIMLGDFLSYYCAINRGIDPMAVKRIDYLKKRLLEYK